MLGCLLHRMCRGRCRLAPPRGCEPIDLIEAARPILGNRGTTLHPIAAVQILKAINLMVCGLMDMSADHAVHAAPPRLGDQSLFECVHKVYGGLDLELDVTRRRPGAEAKPLPHPAQRCIETSCQPLTAAAQIRQPSAVPYTIELVSMRDQQ